MKRVMQKDEAYNKKVNDRLQEVTHLLIKEFDPERIYLFGSYARGDEGNHSSMDILVIAQSTLSFYERIKRAIIITDGDPPIEPLVYTPGELNTLLSQGEGFIDSVLKEGVLLYSK